MMSPDELTDFIKIAEVRIKEKAEAEKEAEAVKEAFDLLKRLMLQFNKEMSWRNYSNVCAEMKKAWGDKECKESLTADCGKDTLEKLSASVNACFESFYEKSSNTGCQHDNIPLLKAVCDKDGRKVKSLLEEEKKNVNETNQYGENALHLAVKNRSSSIATTLLSSNINLSQKDNNGNNPFMLAAAEGSLNIIETMFQKGNPSCTAENIYGQNVFHIAIENNNTEVVEYLIKNPNCHHYLNSTDMYGNTPLHLAAKYNNINAVELLLQYSNPYEIENDEGKTQKDLTTNPKIKQLLEESL